MSRLIQLSFAALFFAGTAVLSEPLHAGEWPERPVTIIVPFGAGGNTDMMARLAAQHLSNKFGQSFIVENRASAGGAIGTGQVATADPDGYTLLFSASANITLTPQLQKLHFDPRTQLVPITNVGTGTQMVAIKRSLPATTLPEFIAYAKANPGKLNYTVAGTQNITHLGAALLFKMAGIDLVMVPAKAEPPAIADLIAGQVEFYFGNSSSLLPHIANDQIRLIGVGTTKPIAAAPDIPPVSDTLPGFEAYEWNGVFVPHGTPAAIVRKLNAQLNVALASPDVQARFAQLNIVSRANTPQEFHAFVDEQMKLWSGVVKEANIHLG